MEGPPGDGRRCDDGVEKERCEHFAEGAAGVAVIGIELFDLLFGKWFSRNRHGCGRQMNVGGMFNRLDLFRHRRNSSLFEQKPTATVSVLRQLCRKRASLSRDSEAITEVWASAAVLASRKLPPRTFAPTNPCVNRRRFLPIG